jgi:hypothetical protein
MPVISSAFPAPQPSWRLPGGLPLPGADCADDEAKLVGATAASQRQLDQWHVTMSTGHQGLEIKSHGILAGAINCTGKNTDGGSAVSSPRRTWLRQFHNRPRLISYRRAISAMPAPGCSVSPTIRSFSAELQRRRRSTPVMISIQPIAPDLSGAHTSDL